MKTGIVINTEDFLAFEKEKNQVSFLIEDFYNYWSLIINKITSSSRDLNESFIQRLLVSLIQTSSQKAIQQRSMSRATRAKERRFHLPGLKGKGTDPRAQYKYQILDYLIHGNANQICRETRFMSQYEALTILSNIILKLELDNNLNYQKLRSSPEAYEDARNRIHEALRADYNKSYVPGTLEGFPKGVRVNSAFGAERLILLKQ